MATGWRATGADAGSRAGPSNHEPEAYERYLRARYLSRSGPETAAAGELLEEVVELDPGFAPAYAVMADAYLSSRMERRSSRMSPWPARPRSARSSSTRPRGGPRHAGHHPPQFDWDPVAGERELKRALERVPTAVVLRFYALFSGRGAGSTRRWR